jgi:hypothetical protein
MQAMKILQACPSSNLSLQFRPPVRVSRDDLKKKLSAHFVCPCLYFFSSFFDQHRPRALFVLLLFLLLLLLLLLAVMLACWRWLPIAMVL